MWVNTQMCFLFVDSFNCGRGVIHLCDEAPTLVTNGRFWPDIDLLSVVIINWNSHDVVVQSHRNQFD